MYQNGQVKEEEDEEDLYAMVRLQCCNLSETHTNAA